MKRKIKFRGKRIDNGKWVEGYYYYTPVDKIHMIQYLDKLNESFSNQVTDRNILLHAPVDPYTVGEFIGLTDKNGEDIYEDDLVQHDAWDYSFEVFFNQEKARFVCKLKTGLTQYIDYERLVVVGNIHDNPELLKH